MQDLLNCMFHYKMIPLTNKPTWVIRHSANVIDHMIINSETNQNDLSHPTLSQTDLSDHFLIVFALKTNEPTQKPVVKCTLKRSYCKKNIENFKNTLYKKNLVDIKKLKTPINHINIFSISLLAFMTSHSQKAPKLKWNSRGIRALELLKILQNHQK